MSFYQQYMGAVGDGMAMQRGAREDREAQMMAQQQAEQQRQMQSAQYMYRALGALRQLPDGQRAMAAPEITRQLVQMGYRPEEATFEPEELSTEALDRFLASLSVVVGRPEMETGTVDGAFYQMDPLTGQVNFARPDPSQQDMAEMDLAQRKFGFEQDRFGQEFAFEQDKFDRTYDLDQREFQSLDADRRGRLGVANRNAATAEGRLGVSRGQLGVARGNLAVRQRGEQRQGRAQSQNEARAAQLEANMNKLAADNEVIARTLGLQP